MNFVERKIKEVPRGIPENILQKHDVDVASDGNCGFRCLALHLFNDQNKWPDVKTDMLEFFRSQQLMYEGVFGYDPTRIRRVLRKVCMKMSQRVAILIFLFYFFRLSSRNLAASRPRSLRQIISCSGDVGMG